MKLTIMLLVLVCFGHTQQLTFDYGETLSGVDYLAGGQIDIASDGVFSIQYDFQNYFPIDGSMDFTFWHYVDAENAADSVFYTIISYPGVRTGVERDKSSSSLITYSSTGVTVASNTTGGVKGDIQWIPDLVNPVASPTNSLPPEFMKFVVTMTGTSADSADFYWKAVYPTVYEREQNHRSTKVQGGLKKSRESLD